jgi:hypothetical protein
MINESLLYAIAGIGAVYVLARYFIQRKVRVKPTADVEIRDILTKDEHRVKGRFE